jgi:hypothetical protein
VLRATSTTATTPAQKKRKSKTRYRSPEGASGVRDLARGVFDRDWDYFGTAKSRILHVSDLLEGKAYDSIKQELIMIHGSPNNTPAGASRWISSPKTLPTMHTWLTSTRRTTTLRLKLLLPHGSPGDNRGTHGS